MVILCLVSHFSCSSDISVSVTTQWRQIYHLCHHCCFGWWAQKSSHIDFCSSVRPSGVQTQMIECSFFVFSPFSRCHRPVVPETYSGSWPNADESSSVYFYWSEWGSGGFSALASEAIKPIELSVWRFVISSGHCKEGQIMQTCSVITTSYFALTMTQNTSDSLGKTKHTKMSNVRNICKV